MPLGAAPTAAYRHGKFIDSRPRKVDARHTMQSRGQRVTRLASNCFTGMESYPLQVIDFNRHTQMAQRLLTSVLVLALVLTLYLTL